MNASRDNPQAPETQNRSWRQTSQENVDRQYQPQRPSPGGSVASGDERRGCGLPAKARAPGRRACDCEGKGHGPCPGTWPWSHFSAKGKWHPSAMRTPSLCRMAGRLQIPTTPQKKEPHTHQEIEAGKPLARLIRKKNPERGHKSPISGMREVATLQVVKERAENVTSDVVPMNPTPQATKGTNPTNSQSSLEKK